MGTRTPSEAAGVKEEGVESLRQVRAAHVGFQRGSRSPHVGV